MKEAQEMLVKWENDDAEVRLLWEKMNVLVYDRFLLLSTKPCGE